MDHNGYIRKFMHLTTFQLSMIKKRREKKSPSFLQTLTTYKHFQNEIPLMLKQIKHSLLILSPDNTSHRPTTPTLSSITSGIGSSLNSGKILHFWLRLRVSYSLNFQQPIKKLQPRFSTTFDLGLVLFPFFSIILD